MSLSTLGINTIFQKVSELRKRAWPQGKLSNAGLLYLPSQTSELVTNGCGCTNRDHGFHWMSSFPENGLPAIPNHWYLSPYDPSETRPCVRLLGLVSTELAFSAA